MGIVVIGSTFVDIKGFPKNTYLPEGRNEGVVEYIHGGVSRNVVEDIANVELRPIFVSVVNDNALGDEVVARLSNHKIDTSYVRKLKDGMGTWLAVFDNNGDLAGSISHRPNLMPIYDILVDCGDEIFQKADSVVVEADLDKEIIKKVLELGQKYQKKIYGVVANMSIATERRDFLQHFDCFVCNRQEAGIFFAENFDELNINELDTMVYEKVKAANIPSMVVTSGKDGAVWVDEKRNHGIICANPVSTKDTTGAGDAFCAGVAIGLTYGKELKDAVVIGTTLASSVIISKENVCPRFLPRELGLDMDAK